MNWMTHVRGGRMNRRKIIVGYDGSAGARSALRWALDEAARTGAPVELCAAHGSPAEMFSADEGFLPGRVAGAPAAPDREPETGRAVEDMLEEAATDAAATHPSVVVDTVIVRGPAAAGLAARSPDADLVVLGSRGTSPAAGPLGSVASAVSAHAHCTVVVIRGRPVRLDPVVVGVDDSGAAEALLEFAFEQATVRGVGLRAVRAWLPATRGARPAQLSQDDAWRSLADLVERWAEKYPEVKATYELVIAHPARALTEAALQAHLVVVGTRGRPAFRGTALGSVSRHLLRHAETSVAVVREAGSTPRR
jgi:nucleotide-binding universal stress UspA family protein